MDLSPHKQVATRNFANSTTRIGSCARILPIQFWAAWFKGGIIRGGCAAENQLYQLGIRLGFKHCLPAPNGKDGLTKSKAQSQRCSIRLNDPLPSITPTLRHVCQGGDVVCRRATLHTHISYHYRGQGRLSIYVRPISFLQTHMNVCTTVAQLAQLLLQRAAIGHPKSPQVLAPLLPAYLSSTLF